VDQSPPQGQRRGQQSASRKEVGWQGVCVSC
jgi:hypothetical protein